MSKADVIEKHYRVTEVADMTGLSVATIRKMVLRREIGYRKKLRAVLIPAREVQKLLGAYHEPVSAA